MSSEISLAKIIARAIFECGDELHEFGGATQRVQFMGGVWPDSEKGMGGLDEASLARVIEHVLKEQKNDTTV